MYLLPVSYHIWILYQNPTLNPYTLNPPVSSHELLHLASLCSLYEGKKPMNGEGGFRKTGIALSVQGPGKRGPEP